MLAKPDRLSKCQSLKEKTFQECQLGCDEGYTSSGTCDCMVAYRRQAVAILAGVPDEYINYGIDSYPGSQKLSSDKRVLGVKGWMTRYVQNMEENLRENLGLLIVGPYGTGKTALLSVAMMEAMNVLFPYNEGPLGYYTTASEMLLAVGGGTHDFREPIYALKDFVDCGVLLIDDLGKEFVVSSGGIRTDYSKFGMVLDAVLRERVSRKLITFMSSNYSLKEIGEQYGNSCLEAIKIGMYPMSFSTDYPNLRDHSSLSAKQKVARIYEDN